MIPESEESARKIVQAILQDDERLVWAGRPCLRQVLFSEVPMLILGVGLFGLFLSVVGIFHLDPSIGWKYQFSPESQQNANVFSGALTALCFVAWPIFSIGIARGEGVYGITTKRLLLINRRKREVWVREACSVSSVSIISNQDGHGSVLITDVHGAHPLKFNYLEHVPSIAKLVAETLGASFDEVSSNPTVAAETSSRFKETLTFMYLPVRDRKGVVALFSSIALWLAYLLLIWVWLGSITSIIGQSWLVYGSLILFSVAVTMGLVLQLNKTLRK
jgi:hypothetical protein